MRMIPERPFLGPGPGGVALITAAGALGGGILGSRASNRATRASTDASLRAEALAREQEANRRKEYEERLAMDKAQWEARETARAEILQRYGRRYTPRPYVPGAAPQTSQPAPNAPSASPRMTLGRMGSPEPVTPPLTAPRPPSPYGAVPWSY